MNFDMDFGALPPEINSARMYGGPGSGPLLAAATAWDLLARELNSTAACYRAVVAGLAVDSWRGPSSAMMAGAAGRYVAWLHATAGQAEQTAVQVRTAAAAYQAAWAATVAPPLIAANRLRLMALIASNFFGQNSPAIAATEADYERMWAQDAVAMHSYAASASSAATLTPFSAPPSVTAPAAAAPTQPAALDPSTLLSIALDVPSLTSAAASTTSSTFSGVAIQTTNHALAVNAMRDEIQGIGPFIAGAPRALVSIPVAPPAVSAVTGRASLVGALSVPQGWAATKDSVVGATATALTGSPSAPAMAPALPPGVFGEAMLGTLAGRGANSAAAKLRRPSVIPRSPAAG